MKEDRRRRNKLKKQGRYYREWFEREADTCNRGTRFGAPLVPVEHTDRIFTFENQHKEIVIINLDGCYCRPE